MLLKSMLAAATNMNMRVLKRSECSSRRASCRARRNTVSHERESVPNERILDFMTRRSWATTFRKCWRRFAPLTDGQMQVSSARNVAMTPPLCPTTEAPGPYFQKEFFHNGYIKSLKQLVHFYNTRDKPGFAFNVTSRHCPPGTIEKVNCWPRPEVPNNIDMTTGNLGLTDEEENQVVAFLQTLTDGFTRPYPNRGYLYGNLHVRRFGFDPR
jgi:hypothetical protein